MGKLSHLTQLQTQKQHRHDLHKCIFFQILKMDGYGVYAKIYSFKLQLDIFQLVGAPLVENCMAGFNSSVFAYGQVS